MRASICRLKFFLYFSTAQIFHDGEVSHFLDGFNESNWMAFVRCARHKREQNLVVFQYHGCIYYRSVKDILPGNELLVWYDTKYTQLLGIPLTWNDNRGIIFFLGVF